MQWNELMSLTELDNAIERSNHSAVFIFKHSTRCGISRHVLRGFEEEWKESDEQKIVPYYLDLLKHCDVSDAIAMRFEIRHESPQLILIRNAKPVYSATHSDIDYRKLMEEFGQI